MMFEYSMLPQLRIRPNADSVEPCADFGAFQVISQVRITIPGENERGAASVPGLVGQVDGHAWMADVGDAHGDLSGSHAICVRGRVNLRTHNPGWFRVSVRP